MGIRPRIEVDRSSPIPLYFQVAEQIAEAIRTGELAPGDQLDSEVQIAEALGLSRPTVRQAIGHLVDRGMIVRRRGVGTQILPMPVRREMELTSLHDDLARSGRAPGTDVLLLARVPAEPEAAAALGLSTGTSVTKVVRLRRSRGEPLAVMRNWLPEPVPQLTAELLETRGLYESGYPHLRGPATDRRLHRGRRAGGPAGGTARRGPADHGAHSLRRQREGGGVRQPHLPRVPVQPGSDRHRTLTPAKNQRRHRWEHVPHVPVTFEP